MYAFSTHDMSAALAAGKPARSAPKTEYSIVVSSDTRKIATLATQNTGHGDAWRTGGSAAAGGAGQGGIDHEWLR